MEVYQAKFVGRYLHSGGIFNEIHTFCRGETAEDARLDLYNRFEHIQHLTL